MSKSPGPIVLPVMARRVGCMISAAFRPKSAVMFLKVSSVLSWVKITCLCPPDKKQLLVEAMIRETTTLGVRELEVGRMKLYREIEEINTPLGSIRVKISKIGNEIVRITPEYEDMKRLAKVNNIPLLKVYETVTPLCQK
jgi:uncharacterized protein (DUF111 family)